MSGGGALNNATKIALAAVVLVAAVTVLTFGSGRAEAHHLCSATGSPLGPFDFETYEAADYKTVYAQTLELAAFNKLFPDESSFRLEQIETGTRSAGSGQKRTPYIPPVILKAIAYNESGWAQASYSPLVEYGEVGPVLSSHDCGYGLMQVTSGMQNISGVPNMDQTMIGTHFAFNSARGARILLDKWNMSPETRPVIGNRDPEKIENWYYALWGYNGWAFQNHPLNPAYSPGRAPFSCGPSNDGLGHDRSQYPYQELIMGCAANPPVKSGTQLWEPQPVHLPELNNSQFSGPLRIENWNPCTYSAQCTAMDIPTPNTSHTDDTVVNFEREDVIGAPAMSPSTDTLNLSVPMGSAATSVSVLVRNTGTGVLGFRATDTKTWLSVTPTTAVALGSDLGTRNVSVRVTANPAGLSAGTHTGSVTVSSLYGGSRTIAVNLTVTTARPPAEPTILHGDLIKGSDPAVYLVQHGLKRHVVDLRNFNARGFSFSSVKRVSDTALNNLPTGDPLLDLFATGALIKGSAPDVYVMDGGVKRHATSLSIFLACGYRFDAVLKVSDSQINSIASGAGLTGSSCPKRTYADGTLIEGPNPGVWVMENGRRRWAVSANMFRACGFEWGNVNKVAFSSIVAIPVGPDLGDCFPEGSLLKGSAPAVYVVQSGVKRHVVDLRNFVTRGYSFLNVQSIPDGHLDTVPTGHPLLDLFATGALIKGSGPDIYVMDGGSKRHATSLDIFLGCGYRFDAVVNISDSTLDSIPTAAGLNGTSCPARTFANETLLTTESSTTVWVIQNGVKRRANSTLALAVCGHQLGNLNTVANSTLDAIPTGSTYSC